MRTLGLGLLLGAGWGPGGSPPQDLAQLSALDASSTPDAAGKPFGAACTMDGDCASGHCFIGGMMSFCTMPCTVATQATDCPNPPTSGTCNMRGFCKP